jgi:hypothetical protein
VAAGPVAAVLAHGWMNKSTAIMLATGQKGIWRKNLRHRILLAVALMAAPAEPRASSTFNNWWLFISLSP